MGFSGRRSNPKPSFAINPHQPGWVQLIAKGGPSRTQKDADGVSLTIPIKRAWRIPGWPALDLDYIHTVGVADPVASREATRAPWARASA